MQPTHVPTPPVVANKRGVHLLLDDGGACWPPEVWREHVEWAARLVGRGGYVVQLIRSDDLHPEVWQPFFDLLAREGLVPIVRLATRKNPERQWWEAPTADEDGRSYQAEAERVRRFFDRITWRTDRVLVTVGNEPNRPDEWGGSADPAAYARYLRDVTGALRRVSSLRVDVLNAGLDSYAPSTAGPSNVSLDPERFLEGMVAEAPEVFGMLDGWASHAYPLGPFGEHPTRQQFRIDDVRPGAAPRPTPPPGMPNRGINGYDWELWKLARLGVDRPLPVYVTESGWRHTRSQAPWSRDARNADVEDDRLGQYIELAFDGPRPGVDEELPQSATTLTGGSYDVTGWTPWNLDPRVRAVALFALAGRPDYWGHTNLLLLDPVGRILDAYPFARRLASVRPGTGAERGPDGGDRR
ncbi:MAG: hypothetical protein H0V51_14030 [Chloroflexi bacterium]|nr:hypothetical protein [Chloroflexota bacterium]